MSRVAVHRAAWPLVVTALLMAVCSGSVGAQRIFIEDGPTTDAALEASLPPASASIDMPFLMAPAEAGDPMEQAAVRAAAGEPTKFIVTFRVTDSDVAAAAARLPASPADRAADPAESQLPTRLLAQREVKAAATQRARVHISDDLDQLPVAVVSLNSSVALAALKADPGVLSVEPDRTNYPSLRESLPQISQPAAAARGATGEGCVVAVLDTGVDFRRSAFGSCSQPGGSCRVAWAKDYAPEDNQADDPNSMHGTNCAAIVAGVAPRSRILSMDVFQGGGASDSWILAAINDVIKFKRANTYNICAISMSLGAPSWFSSPCADQQSYETAFSTLRSLGILSAVATGNDNQKNGISYPACAPSAVRVGAVYDGAFGGMTWGGGRCTDQSTAVDQVTCFSNSANYLDLLAPGAMIDAAGIRMGGTSQATPHVAGAIAVLKAAVPKASAAQVLQALKESGRMVTDRANGISTPRINVDAGVTRIRQLVDGGDGGGGGGGGGGSTSLTINKGAQFATSRTLTLSMSVTGASSSNAQVCFSRGTSSTDCTTWFAYAPEVQASLSSSTPDGEVRVTAFFRAAGGGSASWSPATDAITLDVTAPSMDPARIGLRASQVTRSSISIVLNDEASDATSGVANYFLTYQQGSVAPVRCGTARKNAAAAAAGNNKRRGTVVIAAPEEGAAAAGSVRGGQLGATVTGLRSRTQYSFRVCAVDKAGNMATGVTLNGVRTG